MIQAHALHKRYGRLLAVDDISFKVEPGEVLGVPTPSELLARTRYQVS